MGLGFTDLGFGFILGTAFCVWVFAVLCLVLFFLLGGGGLGFGVSRRSFFWVSSWVFCCFVGAFCLCKLGLVLVQLLLPLVRGFWFWARCCFFWWSVCLLGFVLVQFLLPLVCGFGCCFFFCLFLVGVFVLD